MAQSKQDLFKIEQVKARASAEGVAIVETFRAIKAAAAVQMEADLAAGMSKHQASSKYEDVTDRAAGDRDQAINAIAHAAAEKAFRAPVLAMCADRIASK